MCRYWSSYWPDYITCDISMTCKICGSPIEKVMDLPDGTLYQCLNCMKVEYIESSLDRIMTIREYMRSSS